MFKLFNNSQVATEVTSYEEKKTTIRDIRPQWKARANNRQITKEDIAALCIYRAMLKDQIPDGAKSRLQKSFKPITNKNKLDNGANPNGALETAVNSIKYSVFAQWLDKDELALLLESAKTTKAVGLK